MKHSRYATWFHEMGDLLAFLPRRLTLLSLAVMSGIVIAAAGLVYQDWVQINRAQELFAWTLALDVSDDFNRSVGAASVKLDGFMSSIAHDRVDPHLQDRLEEDLGANSDQFGALLVIDDQEHVRASTTGQFKAGSIADGFKSAIERHSLTFGRPLTVRGERWLPLVRPIGQIGGRDFAIVAMLRRSYFEQRLKALSGGPQSLIGIFEPDGPSIFRLPALPPNSSLADIDPLVVQMIYGDKNFTFTGRSPVDQVDRIEVVMRAGALPAFVIAGLPVSAAIQGWWPRAVSVAALAALLLSLMMILHLTLARELYRRHQAEARIAAAVEEAKRLGTQYLSLADHYQMLAEHSSDVIIQFGFDRVCRYVSPAIEYMLGWSSADLTGKDSSFLVHSDDAQRLHEEVQFLIKGCGPIRSHSRLLHRDGHYLWIESSMQVVSVDGVADSFVANMRDISERIEAERKLAEAAAEMVELAATDQLTGVANRRRFNQELEREWRRTAREDLPLSLLLLDVDFFKIYNDTYGHQGGDDVLKAVAATIKGALRRPSDVVARWGGEEFVVLLPATDVRGAIEVGETVRLAIEALHIVHRDSGSGFLTVSVGVATAYPRRNHGSEPLIAEADANLYEAKRQGRNRVGAPPTEVSVWPTA